MTSISQLNRWVGHAWRVLGVILVIFFLLPGQSDARWTVPVPVTEVNGPFDEWGPFLSNDGLSLYFSRLYTDTWQYARIYEATRETPYGPFTAVNEVLKSTFHVEFPWVSTDNLRMYYTNELPTEWVIRFTQRDSQSAPWAEGTILSELQGSSVIRGTLTADELVIFYGAPNKTGNLGSWDIWSASRPDSSSPFGLETNVFEINSTEKDSAPSVSPDGLTLYFSSERNGIPQLFRVTRPSRQNPFGHPEHLSEFDFAEGAVGHPAISADGKTLFFTRSKYGGPADIYMSRWVEDPLEISIMNIESAIAEKENSIATIQAALQYEEEAIEAIEELLNERDYGRFKTAAGLLRVRNRLRAAIKNQSTSIRLLEKSTDWLRYALDYLDSAYQVVPSRPDLPPSDKYRSWP